MLANIVTLKKNIIITGSHGKTTTTSLVAKILSVMQDHTDKPVSIKTRVGIDGVDSYFSMLQDILFAIN